MGFTVPSVVIENTGLTLENTYMALGMHPVVMTPNAGGCYTISTVYDVWVSFDERQKGSKPIDTRTLVFQWTPAPDNPAVNIYAQLYTRLKALYPASVDVFESSPPPIIEQTPVEQTPVEQTPVEQTPVEQVEP